MRYGALSWQIWERSRGSILFSQVVRYRNTQVLREACRFPKLSSPVTSPTNWLLAEIEMFHSCCPIAALTSRYRARQSVVAQIDILSWWL